METFVDSIEAFFNGDAPFNMMVSVVNGLGKFEGQDPLFNYMQTIYTMLCPLAISICLCICLWEIMQKSFQAQRDLTINVIAAPLLKFLICIFFLNYGLEIIGRVLGLSDALFDYFQRQPDLGSSDYMTLSETDLGGFLIKVIVAIPCGLLGVITGAIGCIIIAVQTITVKLEVALRASFLPLAISNVATDSPRAGWAYIKKTIISCMYLPGIIICIYLARIIAYSMGAIDAQGIAPFLLYLLQELLIAGILPFGAIGAINTMKSLLNEAVAD